MSTRLRTATAGAAVILAALTACEQGAPAPVTVPTTASRPSTCPLPPSGTANAAAALVPAPNNGLPLATTPAEPLTVEAIVLDAGCRPLSDAQVTVWHTDSRGLYGPAQNQCCYYAGIVRTDSSGRFRLETIRPAQYPVPDAPPAHIHLRIEHPTARLETEITFPATPPPTLDHAAPTGHALPAVLTRDGPQWRTTVTFVLP